MTATLNEKLSNIKLLITDVDGVHTDGSFYIGGGIELKKFSALDGLGVTIARFADFPVVILSGRASAATQKRCEELKIPTDYIYEGYLNKLIAYEKIREKFKLKDDEIAYMGDDLIDLPVLKQAGLSIAVANAVSECKTIADHTSQLPGGNGAVREIIELILKYQNRFDKAVEKMNNSMGGKS